MNKEQIQNVLDEAATCAGAVSAYDMLVSFLENEMNKVINDTTLDQLKARVRQITAMRIKLSERDIDDSGVLLLRARLNEEQQEIECKILELELLEELGLNKGQKHQDVASEPFEMPDLNRLIRLCIDAATSMEIARSSLVNNRCPSNRQNYGRAKNELEAQKGELTKAIQSVEDHIRKLEAQLGKQ